MFCGQCGKENPSSSKFCKFCGAQIVSDVAQTEGNQELKTANNKKTKRKKSKVLQCTVIAVICLIAFGIYGMWSNGNAKQEEMIAIVAAGQLYDYSEQTISQAFDGYFSTQEWEYFTSNGKNIVEFNGVADSVYADSYCIQFEILADGDQFEAVYVGLNGTQQTYEFMTLLFDDIYGINAFNTPEVEQPKEPEVDASVEHDDTDIALDVADENVTVPEVEAEQEEIDSAIVAAYDNYIDMLAVPLDVSIETFDAYYAVISSITVALDEEYSFSQLEDNSLSDLLFYHDGWSLGFTFRDINGDGLCELLVGASDGVSGSLVSLYYISDDGEVKLAFNAGERESYILCDDGLLAYSGSSGADSTSFITFELTPYGLIVVNDERTKDFYNLTDEFIPGVIYMPFGLINS